MKHVIIIVALLFTTLTFGQYKDDISIVQFSAPFTMDAEVSLKKFKEYNTFTLRIPKHADFIKKEKVKYLPTIILYSNGEEIVRIHGGISLILPENTIEILQDNIDELLNNKF